MAALQGTKKSKDGKTTDYGTAGAIAEEALSAIHTVTSYGGQDGITKRYMLYNVCISVYTTIQLINQIW